MPASQGEGILSGPNRLPHSLHRILAKLNGRLHSQHYDTFYLEERAQKVHKRAADKLDRFFEAKMKYGRTTAGSKDAGDSQAYYANTLEGSSWQSRQ